MTPSQRIEARLIAQVQHDAETLTDPVELVKAAQAGGYWWAQVSAFTGADATMTREKFAIGTRGRDDTSPERYARFSVPMSAETFPGDAYDREKALEKFHPRIIAELDSLASDAVAVLYLDMLDRLPEPEGRAHYEAQIAAGRPRWEIVREIELSDEAARNH